MMMLFKELQQAQSKLDDAESMKKNLQDRLVHHYVNECSLSKDGTKGFRLGSLL